MKNLYYMIAPLIFSFIILVIVFYAPEACEQVKRNEAQRVKEEDKKRQEEITSRNGEKFANHIANNVMYVKDKRTSICFAVYSHIDYEWSRGYLAAVDCKKAGL